MNFTALLVGALFITSVYAGDGPASPTLESIARSSLEQNIVHLGDKDYLTAGAHQFKSLWFRDFCYASRGLFAIHRADVVRNQLELFLQNRRTPDGLVPRVMDSMSPRERVSLNTVFQLLSDDRDLPIQLPLAAEYQDEHGTEAIDSNSLFLLTALDYVKNTSDAQWWKKNEPALIEVYQYYKTKMDPADGLIIQTQYADWQDSVTRNGQTFYTNLIYYVVSKQLSPMKEFGITPAHLGELKNAIYSKFFDEKSGLFKSIYREGETLPYLSLDGNLLAIDLGFVTADAAQQLYQHLKQSPLWGGAPQGTPGFNTWPNYPASWKSPSVRFARLEHYHDSLYWSWLIALSAKTAARMQDPDESKAILQKLTILAARDKAITEIYSRQLSLFQSWIYRSETPFSWGAGFVLDALQMRIPGE
jgi:hypothetical protein